MPTKTFDVNLDLMNSEYQLIDGIEVVSGDTEANVFNINLLKDYQPVNVTGNTAVIVFLKPDNTTVYQNLTLVDAAAGKFTCTLSSQTIIIPGRVRAEVILYEGTKRLTSTRFEFIVRKSLLDEGTVESSNEFSALTEALGTVNQYDSRITTVEQDLAAHKADNAQQLDNIHIDVSMKPYEIKGLNIQHDTDMMKQAIIDVGVGGSLYLPLSFEINDTLTFMEKQTVKGKNIRISANIGKVIIYPPKEGVLAGLTIDGKNNASSVGISITDANRPYGNVWGKVGVENCNTGLKVALTTNGSAYNAFEYLAFYNCNKAFDINPTGSGYFNANTFGYIFANNCANGVIFNNQGAGVNGLSFTYLEVENSGIAINAINCKEINIKDGWLENNTTNLIIATYPSVNGFTFTGNKDDQANAKTTYNYSAETSAFLTYNKGGNFKSMRGRWWFDNLQSIPENEFSGRITRPKLRGYGLEQLTATSGSTIDVTYYNVVYLNYSVATEITDLTRTLDGYSTHRSLSYQMVTLISGNTNATVKNGGKFRLSAGADWVPTTSGQTLTLMYHDVTAQWIEIARTT